MVGTRRRSSILPEPAVDTATPTKRVAAAAEKVDTPRKSRRLSEVVVEDARPTRSPRTSARGGTTETPEPVSKLVSKVKEEVLTRVRSPRTISTTTPTVTTARKTAAAVAENPTELLKQKTVKEIVKEEIASKTTPKGRAKRVSEIESKPTTPRVKRVSEASEVEVNLATPRRAGRRVSEVSEADVRPATPTRGRRVSEMSEAESRPATPTRKSRRLSGTIPEFVDSPGLPLKKRQVEETSSDNFSIVEEEKPAEEAKSSEELALDVIMEEEEEKEEKKEEKNEEKTEEKNEEKKNEKEAKKETKKEQPEVKENDLKIKEVKEPEIVKEKKEEIREINVKMAESKSLPSDVKKISKNEEELKILEVLRNTILLNPIPWQKRKSGKFWKTERSQFRALKKDRGQRRTFEERLKLKEERIRNNELGNMLMKEKIAKKQDLRQRIAENKKKKEEKQLKNEVYQVVRNPNKIKKMKKSDLVKRDILAKVQ